jgi:hypothetical protein
MRRRSDPGLAVKISSINISGNGISWLQHTLVSQNIRFTLLKVESNSVSSIVYRQVNYLNLKNYNNCAVRRKKLNEGKTQQMKILGLLTP